MKPAQSNLIDFVAHRPVPVKAVLRPRRPVRETRQRLVDHIQALADDPDAIELLERYAASLRFGVSALDSTPALDLQQRS